MYAHIGPFSFDKALCRRGRRPRRPERIGIWIAWGVEGDASYKKRLWIESNPEANNRGSTLLCHFGADAASRGLPSAPGRTSPRALPRLLPAYDKRSLSQSAAGTLSIHSGYSVFSGILSDNYGGVKGSFQPSKATSFQPSKAGRHSGARQRRTVPHLSLRGQCAHWPWQSVLFG